MGGYLVLYPHVRVFCFVPPFLFFALPAWTMLLYWLGLQFFGGIAGLASEEGGGVAFWAHAGGFVAGLVLVKFFARPEYVLAHRAGSWSPRRLRAG
jgi:membrane associated rhomboid family serine protease